MLRSHRGVLTLGVLIHILDSLSQVLGAHGIVVATKLGDHGLQLVRLEPLRHTIHICWEALIADLVLSAEVVVQILVDVDGLVREFACQ